MQKKPIKIVIVIIVTLVMITACSQKKKEESSPPKDDFKKVESSIEKVDSSFIDIMKQVDLIPYYEKQISLKKQQEEEKKTPPNQFKPEPITFTDTLLADILKNEKPQKKSEQDMVIPEEIELIWDEVRTQVNHVHEQWNDLNPNLRKNYISETAITGFGDSLNLLTQSVTDKKYMETLKYANNTTSYLAEFMRESDNKALSPLYLAKYLLRQIVLNSAENHFTKAEENLASLKTQSESITNLSAKKIGHEESAKLNSSIRELETAVISKDVNLIKIKSGVVSKNLASIKEKI